MKRRIGIGAITGFGANAPTKLDGKKTGNKQFDRLCSQCSKDCYETFFKGTKLDEEYVDAQFKDNVLKIGIEATYMYDHERIITIAATKENSYFEKGYCRGAWGSGICSTRKYYSEYKRKGKFIRFVDKWHKKLYDIS